ncbi:MAG: hypothetical protein NC918_06945 [Candidatus Omnitrophica bacterium]|nr:hypothetical protein [Candidatus Omnitrophota bacterium]
MIIEPVQYNVSEENHKARRLLGYLKWLNNLPLRGQRFGIRRFSEAELRYRNLIKERTVGILPRGPSPKEMAFAQDDIPRLLYPHFTIKNRMRDIAISHLIAQEILLMQLSHPYLARLIKWPLLITAKYIERRLLSLEPPLPNIWIFEVFECVPCK